jgi:endonuclease/exonuclease/phosphatase (EEP) superfamily protein YafD
MHARGDGWARLVGFAVLAVFAAALAAALAPLGWPFELFAHFRWQLGAASVVLLCLAVPLRRRWMLVVVGLASAVQLAPFAWPRMPHPVAAVACAGAEFRIATLNLWFRNHDPTRALRWLEDNPADVVVVQEVTTEWAQALAATVAQYPHRVLRVREDPYGIGLLSRWPIERVDAVDFAGDGLPSLVASVDVRGTKVQVIGVHTHWPVLKRLQRARDRVLHRVAALARETNVPTIVAGDINLTPYAPAFHQLERESRLLDALAPRAWRPTWQASVWPLALPIDHVLVPESACVTTAAIGPAVGSDHRAVIVTLRWR